ncbi:MAG: hypothetical protein ABS35_18315 [Kaistia sp. SCN 65-12]|nr:MAG: hypothetical protein ABS35_18315 [Kaistia sp. SCN 65-12]
MVLPHAVDPLTLLIEAFTVRPDIAVEKLVKAVGVEHLGGDFLDDDAIEPIHADAQPLAGHRPLAHLSGTAIIAIGAALARVEHEAGTAMATTGNTGKQRRAVDDARGNPLRAAALKQCLHRVEGLLIDDGGHLEFDPFRWRARAFVAGISAIKMMLAEIGGGGQQAVDAAGREALPPSCDATLVEMGGDCLDAQGTPVDAGGEVKDEADGTRLFLVDDEHLLVAVPPPFGRFGAIAERRA